MNTNLKTLWKSTYNSTVVAFVFCIVLSYFSGSLFPFVFFLISSGRDYYQYDVKKAYLNKLKAKGLTEEDIANVAFVKEWDEARKKGIWLYCITDGGIILGAYLWFGVGVFAMATSIVKFQSLVDDPGKMFGFIGYTFFTGAVIGIIINRIKWPYNERRFKALTDPLSDDFRKATLADQ